MRADGFEKTRVFTDLSGLNELKKAGREDQPEAIKQIAKQFESMLIKTMMSSMRDATRALNEDSPFNSDQMKFYEDMMDQQLSLTLTKGDGLGLANALTKQLQQYVNETEALINSRSNGGGKDGNAEPKMLKPAWEPISLSKLDHLPFSLNQSGSINAAEKAANFSVRKEQSVESIDAIAEDKAKFSSGGARQAENAKQSFEGFRDQQHFVDTLYPLVKPLAESAGIEPKVVVAQAALETGWGKYIIADNSGSSHNLFGIKAGGSWSGERVSVDSVEYESGEPVLRNSDFRKYDSFEASIKDYMRFIQGNPRYANALSSGEDPVLYPQELQAAGYATDPKYAEKITRIYNESVVQSVKDGEHGAIDQKSIGS